MSDKVPTTMDVVVEKLREVSSRASEKSAEFGTKLKDMELGNKLRELNAVESFTRLARRSKVNVMAKLGQVDGASHDPALERRQLAVANTKKVLQDVDKEFALLVKYIGLMAEHYENLSRLLDKFRFTCDTEIATLCDDDVDAAARGQWLGEEGENVDGDFCNIDSAAATTLQGLDGNVGATTAAKQQQQQPPSEIAEFCTKVKGLTEELQATIQFSCMNISRSTMENLDQESSKVAKEVEEKQVTFDLQRLEVNKLEEQLQKAQEELKLATGASSGGIKGTPPPPPELGATTPQPPHVSSAVASPSGMGSFGSMGSAMGGSSTTPPPPSVVSASPEKVQKITDEIRITTQSLNKAREKMSGSGDVFRDRCGDAKRELKFLLEQTSMSTWSCYNIFFTQLSNFFEETTQAGRTVTKALIKLKNSQQIAKTLTQERKDRLVTERHNAELKMRQQFMDQDWSAPTTPAGGGGGSGATMGSGGGFDRSASRETPTGGGRVMGGGTMLGQEMLLGATSPSTQTVEAVSTRVHVDPLSSSAGSVQPQWGGVAYQKQHQQRQPVVDEEPTVATGPPAEDFDSFLNSRGVSGSASASATAPSSPPPRQVQPAPGSRSNFEWSPSPTPTAAAPGGSAGTQQQGGTTSNSATSPPSASSASKKPNSDLDDLFR